MQSAQLNIHDIVGSDGKIKAEALPLLRELVDRYPFYHAARMFLLRLLYQQRDPQFNEELRKAALFLPSRAKIYDEVEGDSMRPSRQVATSGFTGATHARKSNSPIEINADRSDRTGTLIDTFLQATPSVLVDSRSGRPVDATTDYINYMLQEEAAREAAGTTSETDSKASATSEMATSVAASIQGQDLIDEFITNQGDRRIKLSDKRDSELQKPSIQESDSSAQQGAFTETLARIYIKQGKFEHAIEIIRRLSLKYPKKNRYFADQIRFLEKLILNNQGK